MGRLSTLGNDLYNGRKSVDFIGRSKVWYAISGVIILIAILSLSLKGLNQGIEFKGGVEIHASVAQGQANSDNVDAVRSALVDTGIGGTEALKVLTAGDSSILIDLGTMPQEDIAKVSKVVQDTLHVSADNISSSRFGSTWGSEVRNKALTGLGVFLLLVSVFIWLYFREWKMSVAALIALAHDLVITVGIYSLSGFDVTPATVTGVLTILGFSLYDTVVVFDKVRENTKRLAQSKRTYAQQANLAVNQTLVRSINTSIVALLPVLAILITSVVALGDGDLKDLSLALFVGMAAGAYSSIFIASPVVVTLKSREKAISEQERRAKARQRRDADRYAAVPFREDAGVDRETLTGTPAELADLDDDETVTHRFEAPSGQQGAMGSGRVVPESKAPVEDSGSAKRPQPKRTPRSQR